MTRQRGASRGVNSQKHNQNTTITPSEASLNVIPQTTAHATSTTDFLRLSAQKSWLANFLQRGDEELAALRDRARGALAGLRESLAAVRLQRAIRRGRAMRRYVEMLCASRAQRVQESKQDNLGLKKQQLFQAVEGLQDAAGEWLSARAEQRAVQRDEEEPEWLVRAGQELELMLQQWQQRQEERLETEMKPQLDVAATPPSWGHQGRQAGGVATSPVGFVGLDQAASTSTHSRRSGGLQGAGKQGGGRQRKEKISRNAAARDAAAGRGGGPQAARAQSGDAQAEQDRVERQVRAEVVEARQLAAAMQASRDQANVGSQSWGAAEGDDDIDEQFRELCDAAGVAPEDIYRPTLRQPLATGTVEETVFRRKCRRAGVTVACGGQREQLKRLHIARARSELFMRHKLGANWRRVAERNLEAARARYAARQWLATEAQWKAGGGSGGVGS